VLPRGFHALLDKAVVAALIPITLSGGPLSHLGREQALGQQERNGALLRSGTAQGRPLLARCPLQAEHIYGLERAGKVACRILVGGLHLHDIGVGPDRGLIHGDAVPHRMAAATESVLQFGLESHTGPAVLGHGCELGHLGGHTRK